MYVAQPKVFMIIACVPRNTSDELKKLCYVSTCVTFTSSFVSPRPAVIVTQLGLQLMHTVDVI